MLLRPRVSTPSAIGDALTPLWEASHRVCVVLIATLVPALEQHGRLPLGEGEQAQLLAVSAATIDRMLSDVKIAAAGGRRPSVRVLLCYPLAGHSER
ncbi:hypothetical protein ACFIOY_18255 [Bradyrhizobium sp. TZ2]